MDREDKVKAIRHLLISNTLMRERFFGKTTLAQVGSALYTHYKLLEDKEVSMSEVAAFSGAPLSTLHGWISRIPYVDTVASEEDERVRLLRVDDLDANTDYLVDIYNTIRSLQVQQGLIRPQDFPPGFIEALEEIVNK